MTNLYDFLRRILDDSTGQPPNSVNVTQEEIAWLKSFLQAPGIELHFKARKVDEKDGEPVYAQDYAIAGDGVDVFSLLTEAMMQNANFATLVIAAGQFFKDHVPFCAECQAALDEVDPSRPSWKFLPHESKTFIQKIKKA